MAATTFGGGDVMGHSGEPTTLVALLRMLDIKHASLPHQHRVIQAWLDENPPNTELKISLRRNGYGLLLRKDSRG
jgi:hypothetical protein